MNYKLVAIDIDGTLIKNDGSITKRTKEAIKQAEKKGVKICLNTGRNVHNTIKIAKETGLIDPFLAIDGAVVYDPIKKRPISQKSIPKDIIKGMINEVKKENLYMEFCTFNKYIKYVPSKELHKYSYGGVPESLSGRISDYFKKNLRHIKNVDKILKIKQEINMFLFAGDKDDACKVRDVLIERKIPGVIVRDDLWPGYVFVVPEGSNKANGAKYLCEMYNIDMSEVIAIGDQMNDVDVIRESGLGVAMGNAHDDIKAIAKYITHSNEEDGVAHVIEKFILNK